MRRVFAISILLVTAGLGTGFSNAAVKSLVCSLTGKTIETCCCQEKNDKLYCTLADKTIDDCCCHDSKN